MLLSRRSITGDPPRSGPAVRGPRLLGVPERHRRSRALPYHRALRSLLELLAREQPGVLMLDDLHWADDASVVFVLHLLRRPPRGAHLLAFALRPVDPAPRLLDAARHTAGMTHISLRPLEREASLALLRELSDPELRERVATEAAGNPLYLGELARAARQPTNGLPPTLLAAVRLGGCARGEVLLAREEAEYHLSAVYRKLGVHSRTEVAATLARR